MGAGTVPHFSVQEYLAAEQVAEFPSEYIDGQILPLVATSIEHSMISVEMGRLLSDRLRGGPCRVGIRAHVKISASRFLLPDLVVFCGKPVKDENNYLVNPKIILEVLSPSIEAYDRGRKFSIFRTIPTLEEYVLISQDAMHVEVFTRTPENFWLLRAYDGHEAEAELQSVGPLRIPLAEIYAGIELEPVEI